ncbi:MAG: Serine/threonine-protein kinase PrkC [Lentisphaerae bacterium ADurb.Bin242]|nr:MAG: Serine/threonine-protein kinase PrkC [Lentisphaerae bacterium ADurb.Bin242]
MPEFICDHCGTSFQAEPTESGTIVCTSCGAAFPVASADIPLPAGTRVAGFEIIRHLASGGMGNVYVGKQLSMERTVALKILNPRLIDEANVGRFLEEARNTAKFQNPHVVSVIDAGVSETGLYYIAMQYVEGETLEALLGRGRTFTEDEALMTALTVAGALKTIWNKFQMFHKDIKPGNIMLTPDNDAMILDMGIAQSRGASVLINGQVEGSPYYMSPEQARGDVLSWSTDLYSLGATIYQMVTGVFPYDAPTLEGILLKHNSAPFPEPEVRAPNIYVSPQLTALLRRMMGKAPADRFASWEEFIEAARHILTCYWELNGSPVSKTRRRMILGTSSSPALPPVVVQRPSSTLRFAFFGMIIFLLAAALTGGTFLYLAAKKNSSNASAYLHPVRKMLSSPHPDMAAIDSYVKKSEKYFDKFGVAPSVKRDFAELRKRVEEYKSAALREEAVINALDTFVANKLQESDAEATLGNNALNKDAGKAKAHYLAAARHLQEAKDKINAAQFTVAANVRRANMLRQRVNVAAETIHRTLRQNHFIRSPGRPAVPPPAREAKAAPGPAPGKGKASPSVAALPSQPPKEKEKEDRKLQEQKRLAGIRAHYDKLLSEEKNRIRILLIVEDPLRKFGEKNPVFAPFPQKNDAPVLKTLNAEHQKWLDSMEDVTGQAREIWNMLYDSRRTFSGYSFTVPKTGNNMLLGTIIRDEVVLHYKDSPNERIPFSGLHPLEWKAFVKYAAGKKGKKDALAPYFLLTADFMEAGNTKNPFILQELPKLRDAYYRFLSGEKFHGVDEKLRIPPEEALQRHGGNPAFAPYREKILQMIRSQNPTTPKGKK